MTIENYAIYADIGGTNLRFAVQNRPSSMLTSIEVYSSKRFESLSAAIMRYLADNDLSPPQHMMIAIACPITDDVLTMTNLDWQFSIAAVKAETGIKSIYFINDFEAQALALPYLQEKDYLKIGTGTPKSQANMAILGPGTGVGMASLVYRYGTYHPIAGEGGHSLYPPQDDEEIAILKILRAKNPVVTLEHVLSGAYGIPNLIMALATIHQKKQVEWSVPTLFMQALDHSDPFALRVLTRYCAMLGNAAGNLALTVGAEGGVFIGGGIVPRLRQLILHSAFRDCFEAKALAHRYIRDIPTYLVIAEHPALLGLQVALTLQLNRT